MIRKSLKKNLTMRKSLKRNLEKEEPESENDDAIIWEIDEVMEEEPHSDEGYIPREPSPEMEWIPVSEDESMELEGPEVEDSD